MIVGAAANTAEKVKIDWGHGTVDTKESSIRAVETDEEKKAAPKALALKRKEVEKKASDLASANAFVVSQISASDKENQKVVSPGTLGRVDRVNSQNKKVRASRAHNFHRACTFAFALACILPHATWRVVGVCSVWSWILAMRLSIILARLTC